LFLLAKSCNAAKVRKYLRDNAVETTPYNKVLIAH